VQGKTMLEKQSLRESAVQRVVTGGLCCYAKFWLWKKLKAKLSFPSEWENGRTSPSSSPLHFWAADCFQQIPITYSHFSAGSFAVGRRLTDRIHSVITTKTHMHMPKKFPSVLSWVS